ILHPLQTKLENFASKYYNGNNFFFDRDCNDSKNQLALVIDSDEGDIIQETQITEVQLSPLQLNVLSQNNKYKQLHNEKVEVGIRTKLQNQEENHRNEIKTLIEKHEKDKNELIKKIIQLTESNARLSVKMEMFDEIHELKLKNFAMSYMGNTIQ
ncbi:cyclic nucleotide-binding domain containing protein, partial [Reticulomyxa filosa]